MFSSVVKCSGLVACFGNAQVARFKILVAMVPNMVQTWRVATCSRLEGCNLFRGGGGGTP